MQNEERNKTDKILDNICGYSLDENQRNAVLCNEENTLIIAGAGTGKTLTLIGKIRYLIEIKKIKEDEILCISFTNNSTKSLKNKIKNNYGYNIKVLTFHKLALKILESKKFSYKIIDKNYLNFIIEEFFYFITDEKIIKEIFILLNVNAKIKNYLKVIKENEKKLFCIKKLIETFINLYKGKFKNELELKEIFKNKISRKDFSFFIIVYNIYLIYESELFSQRKIDFNDMINIAAKLVKDKGINERYKYILIDEFQDTSYIRYELIKVIRDKLNSKVICVGDDFQSIYRFAGCDLDIFVNFEKYFGDTEKINLQNTYRNSQELLNIAGKFISKNPNQIKKVLISSKNINKPIVIIYSENNKKIFEKLILKIYNETKKNILIIGRNNFDTIDYLNNNFKLNKNGEIIYKFNLEIKLRYLTAHKSKGIEEENVILINCINDIYGFPNKIKNEKVLNYIINTKDDFKYEEERRLFYVSLTRTKNKVYIITNKKKKSIFIKELFRIGNKNIQIIRKL